MRYLAITIILALAAACSTVTAPGAAAPVAAAEAGDDAATILAVIEAQSEAWNQGDIDAFMTGYWNSEDLRFASGGTVERGWQATLARYRRAYPDRAAMGELEFSGLEVSQVSPTAAIVHGAWRLKRANDAPSGLFTLVFRDFGEGWVIVSDTTTSAN